jgi:hypothetical protein
MGLVQVDIQRWDIGLFDGIPFKHFQVEHEDCIHDPHLEFGDHRRDQQTADLCVTQGLPKRAAMQREREEREHGCENDDEHGTQAENASIDERVLEIVADRVPLLDVVEDIGGPVLHFFGEEGRVQSGKDEANNEKYERAVKDTAFN